MTHIAMKRIFNIATYINLLVCLLLICSCSKTSMSDVDTDDTDQTNSYINVSFGTRSSLPSSDENKESGVNYLRVIIFDVESKLVSNTKYTATNAGRVPNPVIKVPGGQKYTIYAIANENNIPIANVLPNKYLAEVLDGVKKISDIEAVAVQLTLVDYSGLSHAGLLMMGSTEVDAKLGHSMIYPQDVSIPLKRLTSKITLNARREAGMTVKIKKVEAKNLYRNEFLIAKSPDYIYPPNSHVPSQNIHSYVVEDVLEGSAAVPFPLFDRYYLGTNYAGEKLLFSLDITYEQKVGTGAAETKTTTITIPSTVERNTEYTFNLNFLQSKVEVKLSVKDWDDQEMSGEVVAGTFLSLSQSELTMYGSHKSNIYLQTDATKVEAELNTEGGELVSKYFSNIQGGISVNKGSGAIVLTPITSAMSSDPAKPTQIGLFFKTGNIRKLVKVTHVNKEAYAINLDANGGAFSGPTETVRSDGSMAIGSGYTIKSTSTHIPTRTDHVFLGWALSKTALLKDFSTGDNVSYEDLERPKELLTLYAVWGSAAKASLVFDPNSKIATNIPGAITGNPGDKVTIPTTVPQAAGGDYIFKEWNTKADGTGSTYAANSSFTLGTELSVLYVIWKVRPVKITLLSNSSPETILATYTQTQDSKFTITAADPTRSGYHFNGWNTLRDGSGTYYAKNVTYPTPSTDLTLYARWTSPRTIRHSFPRGFKRSWRDPDDRVVKVGEQVILSGEQYFKRIPYNYPTGIESYDAEHPSDLVVDFLYWKDVNTGVGYKGPTNTFTMPDRDVLLEAVYHTDFAVTKLWNWVSGTTFTYSLQRNLPFFENKLHVAGSAQFFGYWGKVHNWTYPVGLDFYLYIHSSWEWAPHYRVVITFKNGTRKIVEHYKGDNSRNTYTSIRAREIEDGGGGINLIEILNP